MTNRRETLGDVRLHHPPASPKALVDEHLKGIVRRPSGAEPQRAIGEIGFEDRLKHDLQRGLHDAVMNRRNRKRPVLAASRLGDQHPACRQQPIPPRPQFVGQFVKEPDDAVLLNLGQRGLNDFPIESKSRQLSSSKHQTYSSAQTTQTGPLKAQSKSTSGSNIESSAMRTFGSLTAKFNIRFSISRLLTRGSLE